MRRRIHTLRDRSISLLYSAVAILTALLLAVASNISRHDGKTARDARAFPGAFHYRFHPAHAFSLPLYTPATLPALHHQFLLRNTGATIPHLRTLPPTSYIHYLQSRWFGSSWLRRLLVRLAYFQVWTFFLHTMAIHLPYTCLRAYPRHRLVRTYHGMLCTHTPSVASSSQFFMDLGCPQHAFAWFPPLSVGAAVRLHATHLPAHGTAACQETPASTSQEEARQIFSPRT